VFHPSDVEDPAWLSANFPGIAAIENMDIGKSTGRTPAELARFKGQGLKFVLDVNHASTFGVEAPELVRSLIEFAGNDLSHAHISGFGLNGNPHLLYQTNGAISQALLINHLPQNIPLIHEGVIDNIQAGQEAQIITEEVNLLGSNITL
jgi:hypothetical protein